MKLNRQSIKNSAPSALFYVIFKITFKELIVIKIKCAKDV